MRSWPWFLWLRCQWTLHRQERQNNCRPSHIMQVQQTFWSGQWWFQSGKAFRQFSFRQLSNKALQADSFGDFPTSVMSMDKTADDGTVSIFTKDGSAVHKEQDVLIICNGVPIHIGVKDEHGRNCIPLLQQRGQWQPWTPSKKERQTLHQAYSVYDLPSIEQEIKLMHAVCGYPIKSTWLKAIKQGSFVGWPLLIQNKYKSTTPRPLRLQKVTSTKLGKVSSQPNPFTHWRVHSTQELKNIWKENMDNRSVSWNC